MQAKDHEPLRKSRRGFTAKDAERKQKRKPVHRWVRKTAVTDRSYNKTVMPSSVAGLCEAGKAQLTHTL
jgi:hypothetical protein